MLKWERVSQDHVDYKGSFRLERAKIYGGWLVLHSWQNGETMTFVPDPDHRWDGGSVGQDG